MPLEQRFFPVVILSPGFIWQCLGTFWLSQLRETGMLLASSGWRLGMMLNVLQAQHYHPHPLQQRMIWSKIAIVLRLRNPAIEPRESITSDLNLFYM